MASGLRIISSISGINTNRNLDISSRALGTSLERLSSGLRMTGAADDPAGLSISENLRAQITGLQAASENTQRAANIIGIAEGGLGEINTLLRSVRGLVLDAANRGAVDQQQIDADQAEVDAAVNAIDRIADTTRYADKRLLGGGYAFDVSTSDPNFFHSFDPFRANFGGAGSLTLQVDIQQGAEYGLVAFNTGGLSTAALAADTKVVVQGNVGSETLAFAAGSTLATVVQGINTNENGTGVHAFMSGTELVLRSAELGSDQFVRVEDLSNAGGIFNDPASPASLYDQGADAQVLINGRNAVAAGARVLADIGHFSGEFTLAHAAGNGEASELYTVYGAQAMVSVSGRSLDFLLGDRTGTSVLESFSIRSVHAYNLGVDSGRLSEIATGGDFDLSSNPAQAAKIIDEAIRDVSALRARLGGFLRNTLQTNLNSLSVANENVTSMESVVRDTNVASESSKLTRNKILVDAGSAVLSHVNVSSKTVLSLFK